jgi:hypothetical protein
MFSYDKPQNKLQKLSTERTANAPGITCSTSDILLLEISLLRRKTVVDSERMKRGSLEGF